MQYMCMPLQHEQGESKGGLPFFKFYSILERDGLRINGAEIVQEYSILYTIPTSMFVRLIRKILSPVFQDGCQMRDSVNPISVSIYN